MRPALLIVAFALAGCNATMPQQQARPTAADDPSAACFRGIPANPDLAAIASRIPLAEPRNATLEQLTNTGIPTEQEKAALSLWATMRADCTGQGRQFRARYAPPGWGQALEDGQLAITRLIAKLYAGGTYGAFNSERQKAASEMSANLQRTDQSAMRSAQQQAIVQQGQDALNLQTLQLLQAMQPRPPVPSAPVNCTSTRTGSTVNTSCF